MRQAETLYTENSIRRVRYQPLGTTHLPCERVVCVVHLGCTSTATHLSADGSHRWGWWEGSMSAGRQPPRPEPRPAYQFARDLP